MSKKNGFLDYGAAKTSKLTFLRGFFLYKICECAYNLCWKLNSLDYNNVCCYSEGCRDARQHRSACQGLVNLWTSVITLQFRATPNTQSYVAVIYHLGRRKFPSWRADKSHGYVASKWLSRRARNLALIWAKCITCTPPYSISYVDLDIISPSITNWLTAAESFLRS
jgi:hypothetical protein